MPEGIVGADHPCHDAEARRLVGEVRHELRNYQAVNDIKSTTAINDFERTAKALASETHRSAEAIKADVAKAAEAVATATGLKHAEVTKSLVRIESILKWAGSLVISLILGVLGWSLLQQITTNQQQQRELETQIRLLEQQERTSQLHQPDQRVLPPSAAETALAAKRAR